MQSSSISLDVIASDVICFTTIAASLNDDDDDDGFSQYLKFTWLVKTQSIGFEVI